jgi:hypothetical protein
MSTPKNLVDNLRQPNSCVQQPLLHDGQRVLNVDAGVYAQITATWKAQLNIKDIFNEGYWGLGGRQQQHLAGSTANLPLQGHRQVVRRRPDCLALVFEGTCGPAPRRGTPRPFCD